MIEHYPQVRGVLLAEVLDSLPDRLRHKLALAATPDASDPGTARGDTFVVRQGTGTVTFAAAVIETLQQVQCDCLLAPRCLHLAQALLRCPVQDGPAPDGPEPTAAADGAAPAAGVLPDAAVAVVRRSHAALSALLVAGTTRRDPLQLSTLLRLAHEARAHRLFTLSQQLGALAATLAPGVTPTRAGLVALVGAALSTAHALLYGHNHGTLRVGELGTPRRSYTARDALQLQGVFTEPIVAASGYAGVVTVLRDADGGLWRVSSNLPLEAGSTLPAQARQYYRRAPRLGGISTSHQELGRRLLLVNNVKASPDGRLSAGAKVTAVAGAVRDWSEDWFTGPAGDDISFRELTVRGLSGTALILESATGHRVAAEASEAAAALGALDDWLLLATHPGTVLRCVLRRTPESTVLVAFGVDATQLRLPAAWQGRVMVGLDRLAPAYFTAPAGPAARFPAPGGGPWGLMSRWLGAVAAHGRAAVVHDTRQLASDAATLRELGCGHGATVLLELQSAARETRREFDGTVVFTAEPLGPAWLRLAVFAQEWLSASNHS